MQERDRGVRDARARMAGDLTGDDPQERAAVVRGQQRHLAAADVLVARGRHLQAGRQVDPQLDAVERAAAGDDLLGRGLDVEDAATGGHPLRVAVGDDAAATVGVLVAEHAVEHVGHRLEPAVRVPGRALGHAGLPLDGAHLVHVDERVEGGEVHAGEGAAHREALALEARGRGRDGPHWTRCGDRGVGVGHAWQHEDVVDGDGGHGSSSVARSLAGHPHQHKLRTQVFRKAGTCSPVAAAPRHPGPVPTHHTRVELEAGLDDIRSSPTDAGTLDLIVRRPAVGEREMLDEGVLDPRRASWATRGRTAPSKRTADGGPHPEMQLNVMNARAALLAAAGDPERRSLAGDQLYLDLDISHENLPPGTQLEIGQAVIEVTAEPHNGCAKFAERFGQDAARFFNSPDGKALRLRGLNAKVVVPGTIRQRGRSPQALNSLGAMCRNITTLRGLEPEATSEEIEAAARQYVRKISGVQKTSDKTEKAFERAVRRITAATEELIAELPPRQNPPPTLPPLRRIAARQTAAAG